jgi:hypothetical protein
MNSFNEYQCLRKIYARLIIGAALLPFVIASLGSLSLPFLVISSIIIIITNIYIYAKYYKKNDIGLFNENIGSLLKKTMISFLIVVISLLPIFYTYTIIGSGGYYSMLMIGIFSLFLGMLISWIYYLYNLVKLYKNLDQSLFYLDDVVNNTKLNQFELLKTIYSKYIALTLIAPFIMYYSFQLMVFYVITANLFMFVKYYHKTDDNLITDSFKKMLNVTVLAAIVVAISCIPMLSNLSNLIDVLNNHGKDFLKFRESQKISLVIVYVGFFIGWASCLLVLVKNFKINSDKTNSMTKPELVNTINDGDKND